MKPLHDMPEMSNHLFTTYHLQHKKKLEIIEFICNPFLLRSLLKLILQLADSSNYIVKLAIDHPHHRKKLYSDPNRTFDYAKNSLHLLYNLGNLSVIFWFAYDGSIYIAEPSLVTKKGELPRILSIYGIDI